MSETSSMLSPKVKGMQGFTCATTTSAISMTDLTTSTFTPRLTVPWASGGLTCIRAVLILIPPSRIILSSIPDPMGMWSAFPSTKGEDRPGVTKNEWMRNLSPVIPPKSR